MEEGRGLDVTLARPFNIVLHNVVVPKLGLHGLHGWANRCIKKCLDGQAQRVVINGSYPSRRSVTRGAPLGCLLRPVLFSSDLKEVMECMFMKFADDTKLEGVTETLEGRAGIQRDPDRLEEQINRNPTQSYRNKCNVL